MGWDEGTPKMTRYASLLDVMGENTLRSWTDYAVAHPKEGGYTAGPEAKDFKGYFFALKKKETE